VRAPDGAPVLVTSLELTDPAGIRPPRRPAPDGLSVERTHDPAVNRRLYETIGRDFRWTDRLRWDDDRWGAHAGDVRTWVARVHGRTAGYYELHVADGSVEIVLLGLLVDARGTGLGAVLVHDALHRGFALAPRVWVHTCTDDGPYALANYEARGLRPFDVRAA
jgi:GNAT superfamily N-acetyltransferase